MIGPGGSQHRPNFIERWSKILDEVRDLWPLVWPGKHEDLQHRAVLCGLLFLLQQLLYILVPYLLRRLVEVASNKNEKKVIQEPIASVLLLSGFFFCKFAKDHLCKELQSLLWRKIAYRTEQIVSSRTLRHIFKLPERHETGLLVVSYPTLAKVDH